MRHRSEPQRGLWVSLGLVIVLAGVGWFVFGGPSREQAAGSAEPSMGPVDQPRGEQVAESTDRVASDGSGILEGTLQTKNRSGRSGAYLIPPGTNLPLLVAFHGSGGSGAGLLAEVRDIALRRRFAVVAPDCGFIPQAGTYTWYVAHERGDSSADSAHVSSTIDEVLRLAEQRLAPAGWLAVGHSGGASSAPYLATHDARFSAFGVLHGGAFPNAFGPLRPRGWFSTGSSDPARPPEHVSAQSRGAAGVLGVDLVEMHVFQGGHGLMPDEIEGVVSFWLGAAGAR